MEIALRAALVGWLGQDPALSPLNAIAEESQVRASPPWLGIAASASRDFSHKTGSGREVRVALELQSRGDDIATDGALVSAIDKRVAALPAAQSGFTIASLTFLRGRAERREDNLRATLLEYRFRLIENPTE
ncbi:DUF3168 domain-containing protein [Altererythrobacter sp. MF3-039]|uniref:tail completion protein gp17 n=1 Tax=Altererythrobacter sp. MF3-039 TaxID=3252901 RepID=UPI00390CC1D3